MHRAMVFILLIPPVLLLAFGCSGGNSYYDNWQDYASPGIENTDGISSTVSPQSSQQVIIGTYEIELDTGNLTGVVHPLRSVAAPGDSYNVNLSPFLSSYPCADCFIIHSIGFTPEGYLEIRIQTKHAFKSSDRYDLNVFDLRGILVSGSGPTVFDQMNIDLDGDSEYETPACIGTDMLLNPDGYTSFFDSVIEPILGIKIPGNLYPFINLWVNPSAQPGQGTNYDPAVEPDKGFTDIEHPTGRNVFPMGSDFSDPLSVGSFKLDIQSGQQITFYMVLEASYGHAATTGTRKQPRYFLPEFNRKESIYVKAGITRNDLTEFDPQSSAVLEIKAADWQAGQTPDPNWDFDATPIPLTRYKSDVRDILFDIPGVLNSPVKIERTSVISGTGAYWDPYTWQTTFTNEASAEGGTYNGLVAVRDDLEGSSAFTRGIAHPDLPSIPFTDLTVYQVFTVDIAYQNQPPVAEIEDDHDDLAVYSGDIVNFEPGTSTCDPDGTLTCYEYDFNFDGTFVAEVIQLSGSPDFGLPVPYEFINEGRTEIVVETAFRVTDNGTPIRKNIDIVSFTVLPFQVTLPMFEDFETTLGGEVPEGWGITGRRQNAYFLGTSRMQGTGGYGCRDTSWRWGVTNNSELCEAGETSFLNESGENHPDSDPDEVYQNRACIVYTPEFRVPSNGAIVTVRHRYNMCYTTYQNLKYRDGGRVLLSVDRPGIVTWDDFCNAASHENGWDNSPLIMLENQSGPGFIMITDEAANGHPLRNQFAIGGSSNRWITNEYVIPTENADQIVRIGFLFTSDDLILPADCPEEWAYEDCTQFIIPPWGDYIFPSFGWRINWIRIEGR